MPEFRFEKPKDEYARFLYDYFSSMLKNKSLPKYQFERRVDSLFGMFLEDYLSQYFNSKVRFVLPEFPINLNSLLQFRIHTEEE